MSRPAGIRVTAKSDYALRAAAELAADPERRLKSDAIAAAQDIPLRFLLSILTELTHAGLLTSLRGSDGGYQLTRPPECITLAEVVRAVDGAAVFAPERPTAPAVPGHLLTQIWQVVESAQQSVLEGVTLADLVAGALPAALGRPTEAQLFG